MAATNSSVTSTTTHQHWIIISKCTLLLLTLSVHFHTTIESHQINTAMQNTLALGWNSYNAPQAISIPWNGHAKSKASFYTEYFTTLTAAFLAVFSDQQSAASFWHWADAKLDQQAYVSPCQSSLPRHSPLLYHLYPTATIITMMIIIWNKFFTRLSYYNLFTVFLTQHTLKYISTLRESRSNDQLTLFAKISK